MSSQPNEEERQEAHERARPRTIVIYEAIREEGEDDLKRSIPSLAWSALAAGLSMTLSLLAMGAFAAHLPPSPWQPLIVGLGYPLGYLIVILGRQQLFTENTLTPLLPILSQPSPARIARVALIWAIVLSCNLIGALGGALFLAWAQPLPASAVAPMVHFGLELASTPAPTQFAQAIFAGWLIALMVWLLPLAETAGAFVIILITYVVGIAQLAHIIAGSIEMFYAMWRGQVPWAAYGAFFGATALGNIVGGVAFVTLIAFAQIVTEGTSSRKGDEREPKAAG